MWKVNKTVKAVIREKHREIENQKIDPVCRKAVHEKSHCCWMWSSLSERIHKRIEIPR